MSHIASYNISCNTHDIISYIISNHARKSIALSKFPHFPRLTVGWPVIHTNRIWDIGGMIPTGQTELLAQNMRHWWDDTDRANRITGTEYETLVGWYWQGKPNYWHKFLSSCNLVCQNNSTCIGLGSKPKPHGDTGN